MSTSNIQEVVGIVDRSGSMIGKEEDTIGGINVMLKDLKENSTPEDDIRVSLKLFDHEEQMIWRSIPLEMVNLLSVSDFKPRGQTALLDALGNTLNYFMEKRLMNNNAYKSCLIYVATDGKENCSKYYTKSNIKKLITNAKEKYNIDVIYLGANQDAILEASSIGIDENQAINYNENPESTQAVYRAISRAVSIQRSNSSSNFEFTQQEREESQQETSIPTSPQPPPITRSPRLFSYN